MRTERRTDMTKLIVAFRNFTKAPNNSKKNVQLCGSFFAAIRLCVLQTAGGVEQNSFPV
jgi:uncharacterized membrane protein YjjP (DUF1212 family)